VISCWLQMKQAAESRLCGQVAVSLELLTRHGEGIDKTQGSFTPIRELIDGARSLTEFGMT